MNDIEYCNYPDCNCPFDMLPEWACCKGRPEKEEKEENDENK